MLDKQGVYDCLRDHHIDFEVTDRITHRYLVWKTSLM